MAIGCLFFSRRWKWPRVLIGLFIFELAGTVAALALFGIADPDLFRTKLWQIGSDNDFNSSPSQILYAYANHVTPPKTPFVWSQTLTSFNLVISVLSTFILLVKAVMFVLHVWYPLLGTVTNAALTAIWIVSVYGQAGPDHSDPKYPSSVAWYITKSCSYAAPTGNEHYCLMAKGTFAVSVIMAAVFFLNFLLGVYSMIPSAAERASNRIDVDDMQISSSYAKHSPASMRSNDKAWEMTTAARNTPSPAAPQVPYTPRTLAFNTLDRQLPLRADPRYAPPPPLPPVRKTGGGASGLWAKLRV